MFNSIFGGLGGLYQTTVTTPQSLQNSISMSSGFQTAQQQMQAYNNQLARQFTTAKWMINGQKFNTAEEFALHLWPDDENARLMFVLKYGVD